MFSTLMAVVTIDRWGRRVGLYWGAIGQGISLILAGAFARLLKEHPDKAAQYGGAAAFFVFMYTAVFGATWLTIPWVCLLHTWFHVRLIMLIITGISDGDVPARSACERKRFRGSRMVDRKRVRLNLSRDVPIMLTDKLCFRADGSLC